jgi:hypothetical protein
MLRVHHLFLVLPLTALVGGCGSEEMLDDQRRRAEAEEFMPRSMEHVDLSSQAMLTTETAPLLEDPCAGVTGLGTYKGYTCETSHNFIIANNISCQDTRRKCALNAENRPGLSFFCTWNDQVVFRKDTSPGVCNPLVCSILPGTGRQEGYICGSHKFLITDNSTCEAAVELCAQNADLNPSTSFLCTWKGTEVYRKERVVGACLGTP